MYKINKLDVSLGINKFLKQTQNLTLEQISHSIQCVSISFARTPIFIRNAFDLRLYCYNSSNNNRKKNLKSNTPSSF